VHLLSHRASDLPGNHNLAKGVFTRRGMCLSLGEGNYSNRSWLFDASYRTKCKPPIICLISFSFGNSFLQIIWVCIL